MRLPCGPRRSSRVTCGRTLPDAGEGLDGYRLREIPEAYAALRPKELFSNEKVYHPLARRTRTGACAPHALPATARAVGTN